MRLSKPRVDRVESSDGASALCFERFVSGRDGGALYRFTVSPGDVSQTEISAIVMATAVTSLYATEYAKDKGLDVDSWSLVQQMDYLNEFAEKHGSTASVREFVIENKDLSSGQIEKVIEIFVNLFFELNSSYKLNKEPREEKGYYPDKINFEPYELDKKFHKKYDAGGLQA